MCEQGRNQASCREEAGRKQQELTCWLSLTGGGSLAARLKLFCLCQRPGDTAKVCAQKAPWQMEHGGLPWEHEVQEGLQKTRRCLELREKLSPRCADGGWGRGHASSANPVFLKEVSLCSLAAKRTTLVFNSQCLNGQQQEALRLKILLKILI